MHLSVRISEYNQNICRQTNFSIDNLKKRKMEGLYHFGPFFYKFFLAIAIDNWANRMFFFKNEYTAVLYLRLLVHKISERLSLKLVTFYLLAFSTFFMFFIIEIIPKLKTQNNPNNL